MINLNYFNLYQLLKYNKPLNFLNIHPILLLTKININLSQNHKNSNQLYKIINNIIYITQVTPRSLRYTEAISSKLLISFV